MKHDQPAIQASPPGRCAAWLAPDASFAALICAPSRLALAFTCLPHPGQKSNIRRVRCQQQPVQPTQWTPSAVFRARVPGAQACMRRIRASTSYHSLNGAIHTLPGKG
ncbi:uncharacterized protein TrAtP1_001308 [Trichoderma atroviride]|uniref:uncharacterized protein n=1 Tax=Hypocrea atroviridis TaxID=63577 RepID=UPI00331B03EA|nr:hypothetical protein TrAtP1_001308 [Trichoderma atroviride]